MIHPVKLPRDFDCKRALRTTRTSRGDRLIAESELSQYDFRTLFYDVFLTPRNDRLCLVGPPLLNLARLVTPVTVTINGRKKRLSWREYFRRRILIAEVNLEGVEIRDDNDVTLSFKGLFEWRDSIPANNAPEGTSILVAIQKNNRINWIMDWCRYYRQQYDIDRIIIYDNGSDNRDELVSAAAELPCVEVEDWDFPYGIYRSHGNKYCQAGALNHCRLKQGNNSILFNFDIDELLVFPHQKLKMHLKYGKIIKFGYHMVPVVDELPDEYSFRYFNRRTVPAKNRFQKYVCKTEKILVNHVHTAQHKPVNFVTNIDKFFFRMSDLASRISGRFKRMRCMMPYQEIPVDEGFFLHYRGINTGWKSGPAKFRIREDESDEYFYPFSD